MYLVKCSCNCWYTLMDDKIGDPYICKTRKCPNCGKDHGFDETTKIESLAPEGIEIERIPDNSNIEVKFNI